jgi:hypothetical protein
MPWCDDCSKFWNPNSMPPDGTCPTCGRIIADMPDTKVPWHFWLLVVALTLYLGWRLVQGVQWLVDNGHTIWAVVVVAAVLAIAGWAFNWWRTTRGDSADAGDD